MLKKYLTFKKCAGTKIVPVTLKILLVFTAFLLISNFSTNFVNLTYNITHQIITEKEILIDELKEMYNFCNAQHEILFFSDNKEELLKNIHNRALYELKNAKAFFLAADDNGKVIIFASRETLPVQSLPAEALQTILSNLANGSKEGLLSTTLNKKNYFGAYKYNKKLELFLYRAEQSKEFFHSSKVIFYKLSAIILCLTILSTLVGIRILREILKYIDVITTSIMDMIKQQKPSLISLDHAPSDNITYLGVAFNTLSNTVDNLLRVFKKFTNRDVVEKAHSEKHIELSGEQKELVILFADITKFTTRTEALGSDIIKLINLFFDRGIRKILDCNGTIGAIIGDALLAMFGVMPLVRYTNKSYSAIIAAYDLIDEAAHIRSSMEETREKIISKNGGLSPEEEKIFDAVLVDVGVGIDGGKVYYGTIGSHLRMTNTVIGDNVNTASRLEGLTRIYEIPVICSDYVKDDISMNMQHHDIHFIEIDRIQVKGKKQPVTIYWPVLASQYSDLSHQELSDFSEALKKYYNGHWVEAYEIFKKCGLTIANEFARRTKEQNAPEGWSGVWTMTTK